MDNNEAAVIGFLVQVPLLQRLPSSSLAKIAQIVQFKHYNSSDYVVREGEIGDGVYFIWEGEAEVQGTINGSEEFQEHQSQFQLKRYDCFGHGTDTSYHQANVIALTKLTCLVVSHEYSTFLHSKSIWIGDETHQTSSTIERILQLDPLEVNIFRGFTPADAARRANVYGGQLVGQALAAATKTIDCRKLVHSLHSCFLLGGDFTIPIIYQVYRLRDGNSYDTRRVDAIQNGNVIFTLLASFQKEEKGFEHQEVTMPSVPAPETLLTKEELRKRQLFDPRLPRNYRNKAASEKFIPWPVDIRFCKPTTFTNETKAPSSTKFWFKAWGKFSDDLALHRCVVAYVSDFVLMRMSLNPHRSRGLKTLFVSLDHSMWFHRPFRADEWLLSVVESPSASNGRGFCTVRVFNRKGELVVSIIQEGVVRKTKTQLPVAKSSL